MLLHRLYQRSNEIVTLPVSDVNTATIEQCIPVS